MKKTLTSTKQAIEETTSKGYDWTMVNVAIEKMSLDLSAPSILQEELKAVSTVHIDNNSAFAISFKTPSSKLRDLLKKTAQTAV